VNNAFQKNGYALCQILLTENFVVKYLGNRIEKKLCTAVSPFEHSIKGTQKEKK
jgi:hypothetical protein